jgi:hypothetical protein
VSEISEDDLLSAPLPGPGDPAFRQALLARTTRLVRRRLWVRRGAYAAALAACYIAGLLTTRPDRPPQEPAPETQVAKVEPAPPVEASPSPKADPPEQAPAIVLEQWGPLVAKDRRADLYRRAGDRYLAESNDTLAALRCYRQALDAAPDQWDIAAEDSWLLMTLKEARIKERRDGKTN